MKSYTVARKVSGRDARCCTNHARVWMRTLNLIEILCIFRVLDLLGATKQSFKREGMQILLAYK